MQGVRPQLLRAGNEARQFDAPFVGFAVAVGVAQENQVRRVDRKDSVAIGHHRRREIQSFGKDDRLFVDSVAVVITQLPDAAFVLGRRVSAHFGHVHAAVGVPGQRHRADDIGLGRNQIRGK